MSPLCPPTTVETMRALFVGAGMKCLLTSVSKLTQISEANIIDYLGHDGSDGRGFNIFEMMEFLISKTKFKPVYLERVVHSSDGLTLNDDLTAKHYDLPVPKIVTSVIDVPHAVAMFRDGSVYDPFTRRIMYDGELAELADSHHSIMLLF